MAKRKVESQIGSLIPYFALDLILIEGFHEKLWGPKVAGDPTLGIPRQNVI
jgi:hypothetical protein